MSATILNQRLKRRKAWMFSALFFIAFSSVFSCKKSGELTPANSSGSMNARFSDDQTVQSVTLRDSLLRTDEVSRTLFGILNDPVFGITRGSGNSQFNLSTAQLTFPDGAVIDSVVLKLAYDNLYGKEGSQLGVNVYELNETIIEEDAYYNNSKIGFNSMPIGTSKFTPDLTDSSSTDTSITSPHLSVTLSKEIGERILNNGVFASNEEFINVFKGIHFEPDTTSIPIKGEGIIVNFNLLSDDSRIFIYYNYPGEGGSILTAKYELIVSTGTPRFSTYIHDYSSSEVEGEIKKIGSAKNYIQPLGGLKTRIDFPHLKGSLLKGQVVINKAELVITVAEGSEEELTAPGRLVVLTVDDEGNNLFIPDFFEGTSYYGGSYDINSKTYRFNIARYLDEIVNERTVDRGLFLQVSGSAVNANRLVLNSGTSAVAPLKLNLTYTEL